MITAIAAIACIGTIACLLNPGLLRSDTWRATSTPLASIIGSGFLVALPILTDLVGSWAIAPMIVLLLVAYWIGAAIRYNIAHVEPVLASGNAPPRMRTLEHLSDGVLTFAYFVSVAYYLVLFASFLLKYFGITDVTMGKWIVTALLASIGGVGYWRGFRAVEGIEIFAVSIKLAVIAGLIAAVVAFDASALPQDFKIAPGSFSIGSVPALLGLLIVVQGFETSRFLGDAYDAQTRIRTMKLAQLISAAIYVSFFLVMIPVAGYGTSAEGVTAIVDMLRPVSFALPLFVTIGALASQSSAAIADTLGASGLVHSNFSRYIAPRDTYPILAGIATVVTWETNVFGLVAFASRCFALYYALQCAQAASSAMSRGQRLRAVGFAGIMLIAVAVLIFGAPAEGA
ncbi:MAG: hypothetical protein WC829_12180 [Hyphomicrobium sp.]|jgi:hypothetical protein